MFQCVLVLLPWGLQGGTALDGEYVSTHLLATSRECFLVVYRIWRGTLQLFMLRFFSLYAARSNHNNLILYAG